MRVELPRLTLVLGGAASGKSAFAEGVVSKAGRPRVYIATAMAFDEEMSKKIADHRESRGPDWRTIEAPRDLTAAFEQVEASEVVLLDCATLWLSNVMLAEEEVALAVEDLFEALEDCAAPVVVVSNETGMGVVPEHKLGRTFRNAQGRLNQRLAAKAECVVLVTAGLPLFLKGSA
ncbi:bifunctional adenosylcobinamide kinase/adenosylcobinamide-phosphate guanylyltransferase [Dinoroseobacter sp. S124A]|uniref:bifunctional adenosylcobinamide kinase/adenosylcobinamide-phosphate guanylyltransferase n=1 Tax=Dinoroseobacter sp. S124A TaxID=3415128 RepID=UPI003C79A14F